MSFKLDHWNSPRKTIALGKDPTNDMTYTLTGMRNVLEILSSLRMLPEEFNQLNILDYGCGTGRLTRPFSMICKSIDGYDPNIECIRQANIETTYSKKAFDDSKIRYYNNFKTIQHNKYDFIFSSDVLEHLPDDIRKQAFNDCSNVLTNGGIMLHRGTRRGFIGLIYSLNDKVNICRWDKKNNKVNLIEQNWKWFK